MHVYLDSIINLADQNAIIRQLEAASADGHIVTMHITGGGTTNVNISEAIRTVRNLR